MSRAIDADRLLQVLETNFGHIGGADVMRQLIEAKPTLTPPVLAGGKSMSSLILDFAKIASNGSGAARRRNERGAID